MEKELRLTHCGGFFRLAFRAMASDCEFLVASEATNEVERVCETALLEVRRIEAKFSRYLNDNLCFRINNAAGSKVVIDDECYRLLQFADTCYELSGGMFDITSGVLRRVWHFDCSENIPRQAQIDKILALVGWDKVKFTANTLQMPAGMEIDFGGVAKEYAVSRAADIFHQRLTQVSVLVNLGGDIQVTCPRSDGKPWNVGIEDTAAHATENPSGDGAVKGLVKMSLKRSQKEKSSGILSIKSGALATSGDAKRFLLKDGVRYSHILNPKTGWPVRGAPASITVAAPLCIQAGCLATLSLLTGPQAENFLRQQEVRFWAKRGP